jgi:tungstate transport system permease protein
MTADLQGFIQITFLTLGVSGTALAISAIIGIPLGAFLGLRQFRARQMLKAVIYTGMGLPPVVVGLAVYLFLSRSGPLGGLSWLFSPAAMVFAQTLLAVPLVAGLTGSAIEALDPELRLQLRSLGATSLQESLSILREARGGVVASVVVAFGAIISEVGAAMLVGGNIEGSTRVLSTAIVLETRRGHFGLALALGGALLSLTFIVNWILLRLQRPNWRWR